MNNESAQDFAEKLNAQSNSSSQEDIKSAKSENVEPKTIEVTSSETSQPTDDSPDSAGEQMASSVQGEQLETETQDTAEGASSGESNSDVTENPDTEIEEKVEQTPVEQIAELNDKYVRLLAEFENFKRRSAQEMQSRFKYASQSLALNIISGLDNLERAIEQAKVEENEQLKEFVTGIEMVQQQFYEAFEKNNIERFSPKGEPFDPNKHEAMGVIQTEEVPPDHVSEVFQAGYTLHDRVIRPAMVQVAKKK